MTKNSDLGAIILAGGVGSRLGGVDKALLEHDGEVLLARLVRALALVVSHIVIVGEPRDIELGNEAVITWTLESPAGGGPLAGLTAGVNKFQSETSWFFALACDQPFADRAISPLLSAARSTSTSTEVDGVLGMDQDQRPQALTAIYRKIPVDRVLQDLGPTDGMPMRALVKNLNLATFELPLGASQDVDTAQDLAALGMTNPGSKNVGN